MSIEDFSDVSRDAMQKRFRDFAENCRAKGVDQLRQGRIAVEAFLALHGVNRVMELAPAQRRQFREFCAHLERIIV